MYTYVYNDQISDLNYVHIVIKLAHMMIIKVIVCTHVPYKFTTFDVFMLLLSETKRL